MNTFAESKKVEQLILDAVITLHGDPSSANWSYSSADQVPRQFSDVIVEPWLREALIHLNSKIVDLVDQVDELLYDKYPSIRCTEDNSHE